MPFLPEPLSEHQNSTLRLKVCGQTPSFQSHKDHEIKTYNEIMVPGKFEYPRYDNTNEGMIMKMIMILLI